MSCAFRERVLPRHFSRIGRARAIITAYDPPLMTHTRPTRDAVPPEEPTQRTKRDYTRALARLASSPRLKDAPRADRMTAVADAIWDACHHQGVSWVGFYIADESQPDDQRLVLGPRRDAPACSPIGVHGVCGAAYRTGEVQIVRDVAELGDRYVACDPRDRAEIVLPLFEDRAGARACWGVLDLDSRDVGAFEEYDATALAYVLSAADFGY